MLVGFFLILILFFGLAVGVGGTILWIWAIIDCIQNRRLSDGDKVIWTLVIVFTHLIGAIIYFAAGRSSHRMALYPYAGQRQPYQYPHTAPGQQQPYQYYQPPMPMPMHQTQQGYYTEIPQASYPEPYPPQE
ncbi:MAG TPA: PLD nuclease N-terminal domain-containing protein [Ktedonobacteraceae bacterium]|jgi:hypothetical protein